MPSAKEGHWVALLALAASLQSGCRSRDAAPYETWLIPFQETEPKGVFALYCRSAAKAEAITSEHLDDVKFTPGRRRRIVGELGSILDGLRHARSGDCVFEFQPERPFERPLYRAGWRMIGRALGWRIELAVAAARFDGAIADTLTATKFGMDLTEGSALDAELGLAIVDDARRAIAHALPGLSVIQLARLGNGVSRILASQPPVSQTLEHERLNMLAAVQWVQDAYREERLSVLSTRLGPHANNAVEFLNDLRDEDGKSRTDYFRGFAAEAERTFQHQLRMSTLSRKQRQRFSSPSWTGPRPWWRLSKHFFTSAYSYLNERDECLARTRLLGLEALCRGRALQSGAAPHELTEVSKSLSVDPYSGKPFIYREDGRRFVLYSVGEDFQDNGGETDEEFARPDLILETR